jgi:hypothetical protein
MLKAHLDAVEQQLLHTSQIPANAGHMLHRGTPREAFIKQFLVGHLSAKVAVGTGEIIDASSLPRAPRNQFDIVIYKADYPKIDLGGGISAFLAESVVATIEVKSLITQAELQAAISSANRAKKLQRNLVTAFTSGYVPPGILSYVVAYDGPVQISTVYSWLKAIEASQGLNQTDLPTAEAQRLQTLSESLEGIILLGKGSILFDNAPISLANAQHRTTYPSGKYQIFVGPNGNLMWLFLLLTQAASNTTGQWGNLVPYLQRHPMTMQFMP